MLAAMPGRLRAQSSSTTARPTGRQRSRGVGRPGRARAATRLRRGVLRRAARRRARVVCFMDCDGSLDPAELHLVAARCWRGAPISAWEHGWRSRAPGRWHARLANRVLAFELRRRTGAALSDLGPMRARAGRALLELELRDRGFGWPLEMVLRAAAGVADRRGRRRLPAPRRGTLQGERQCPRDGAGDPGHGRPGRRGGRTRAGSRRPREPEERVADCRADPRRPGGSSAWVRTGAS